MTILKNLIVVTALSLICFSATANNSNEKYDTSPNRLLERTESKPSIEELKKQFKKSKAETAILERLIKQREDGKIHPLSCSGAESCCCRAGSIGFCTTKYDCEENIGGSCVGSAPGC